MVGAGPSGLAAAIHLQRGGLSVLCIEPDLFPWQRVGESLDRSSPGMLAESGILKASLIAYGVATYKKHIEIVSPERPAYQAQPGNFCGSPLN